MASKKMTFADFCERLNKDRVCVGVDWHIYSKNGKPLSRMSRNGYYVVRKMYDGHAYCFMEHRVIWYLCKGGIDENMVINHKDFDRTNNNINNLELVSQKENVAYSADNNRYPDRGGVNNPKAALTEEEVRAIRYMAKNGWTQKELAVLFNAKNQNLISRVVTGARYGNVQDADSIMSIYPTIVAKTHKDGSWDKQLTNACFGIAGESGELVDMVKKHLFHGHDLDINHLLLEIGDVMYYLCWLCQLLNLDFYEVCYANMDKLNARYPDGFDSERSQHRAKGDV
jgi:NTP pyrophosphatase (non-canonical NTP hydrolase)